MKILKVRQEGKRYVKIKVEGFDYEIGMPIHYFKNKDDFIRQIKEKIQAFNSSKTEIVNQIKELEGLEI